MLFNSLDEIFDDITSIREKIYSTAEQIPAELGSRKLSPEVWSAAEALDHIGRSEEIIVSRFKQLLDEAKAESASHSAGPSESTEPVCFFRSVSMEKIIEKARGQKFSAPARVAALPDATIPQALKRLRKTRTDLLSLRPQIETLDLRDKRFPHPIFGELNIYEWLAFIGMHEKRHLDQIVSRVSQLEKEVIA